MKRLLYSVFILVLPVLAQEIAPASPAPVRTASETWNGLSFGMSIEDVIARLKKRKLEVVKKESQLVEARGDMGGAPGSAQLFFSFSEHHLVRIVLTFDSGDLHRRLEDWASTADISAPPRIRRASGVSNKEAEKRAFMAGHIAGDYLKRYGRPFYMKEDGFPTSGHDALVWCNDKIARDERWAASATWKWREQNQLVEFQGFLIGRSAMITVEYSPEDHNF